MSYAEDVDSGGDDSEVNNGGISMLWVGVHLMETRVGLYFTEVSLD